MAQALNDAVEFETQDGARLKAALIARLESLRLANDSLDLNEVQTAEKRGRIAEIKSLLSGPTKRMAPLPTYGAQRSMTTLGGETR